MVHACFGLDLVGTLADNEHLIATSELFQSPIKTKGKNTWKLQSIGFNFHVCKCSWQHNKQIKLFLLTRLNLVKLLVKVRLFINKLSLSLKLACLVNELKHIILLTSLWE